MSSGTPNAEETLGERASLPRDLSWLRDQYPREIWVGHANIGQMTAFWLRRHELFRNYGRMLTDGISAFRENSAEPSAFAKWFAPRIQHFLGDLDAHHNIEDHHYFPHFKLVEPRLARGFELLDNDHHTIHDALEKNAEVASELFERLIDGKDPRFAVDNYALENERLISLLHRHLHDEEDLIVPMVLDRGEDALGFA